MQLLVQHMGRLNFSPYLGEHKGVAGAVYLGGQVQDIRRDWQMEPETGTEIGTIHLDEVNSIRGGTVLRRSFTLDGMDRAVLVGAPSKGLRINGIEIPMPAYQDWFAFQTLDISGYVKSGVVNTLEMPYSRSPLNRLELITYLHEGELQDWRMAGTDALLPASWESCDLSEDTPGVTTPGASYGQPVWYRWRFAKPVTAGHHKVNLMLRLTGMSKGTIHVNGHHLGRYWQIGPQEDYKIPVAWLREENELLIFDEEGRTPERVRLLLDEMSRYPWSTVGQ